MRPIDADALNKVLQERVGSPMSNVLYEVNLCIIEAPTLDVASVVHGQWLGRRYDFKEYKYVIIPYDETTFDNPDDLFCSVCNKPALLNGLENDVPSKYCPSCGAKMEGETNG